MIAPDPNRRQFGECLCPLRFSSYYPRIRADRTQDWDLVPVRNQQVSVGRSGLNQLIWDKLGRYVNDDQYDYALL